MLASDSVWNALQLYLAYVPKSKTETLRIAAKHVGIVLEQDTVGVTFILLHIVTNLKPKVAAQCCRETVV